MENSYNYFMVQALKISTHWHGSIYPVSAMKLTTHDTQEIEITLFLLFTNQFCTENRRLSS